MDEPNPELDAAIGIKSDDLGLEDGTEHKKSRKLNTVVRRQLQNLPIFTPIDVERAMQVENWSTVADFIQADAETLRTSAAVTKEQSEALFNFLRHDFRMSSAQ